MKMHTKIEILGRIKPSILIKEIKILFQKMDT